MNIKGVKFSNCLVASGALSFFGSGYWYHNLYRLTIPGFEETDSVSFVAKTTTLNHQSGNLPLDRNSQPREIFPKCIKIYPLKGAMLNSIDLSGPGALSLFATGNWQEVNRPFMLSFVPLEKNQERRRKETEDFCGLLVDNLPQFRSPIGLQLNLSCPKTEHDPTATADEALQLLAIVGSLGIPIDLKVNISIKTEVALAIQKSGLCDVLTISNTIPYGTPGVNWPKVTGRKDSPLADLGGGELSGRPILPLVLQRIRELRRAGLNMLIKGGGGIFSASDVRRYSLAGANAVEIASVITLRPWRIKSIIQTAREIF